MREVEDEARRLRTETVEECPVCRGRASPHFEVGDRLHGVEGRFRYRRCESCGTVFQDPRVVREDLGKLYPGVYYTHAPRHTSAWSPPPRPGAGFRDRVRDAVMRARAPEEGGRGGGVAGRLLSRFRWMRERAFRDQVMDEMLPWRRPPGAALDVGCGAGGLLPRLAAVGWEPQGLEWDPEAARVARDETGFPVHVGSARRMDPRLGPFDLVTLVHVFEHLADPVDALGHLGSRLTDDGRLVLVYPNPGSLMARFYGPDWFGWEVPRHLTLLPGPALGIAAERAGLRLRTLRTVTRWAAAFSWQSRALRRGAPTDPEALLDPQPTIRDRMLGWLERAAVLLGADVGEEIVAVLEPVNR